jgi:hypothetical protein
MDETVQKRLNSFCRNLRRTVRCYLDDPEHRQEFEDWYLRKYGKPYQWKKESESFDP